MPYPHRWWIVFIGLLASEVRGSPDLQWQGFFTSGVGVSSRDVPYQGLNKRTQFSKQTQFGLQLSNEWNEEWRVNARLLSRAGSADGAAKLDQVYATWQPIPLFHVSVGRQNIPLLMHSTSLDIGRSFPWSQPPEEVYELFNLRSFGGALLYAGLPIGASRLGIKFYSGDVIQDGSPDAPTPQSDVTAKSMVGTALEWTAPSWQLRAAYNIALWNLDQDPVYTYGERRMEFATIGMKGDFVGWKFWAEHMATRDQTEKHYDRLANEMNEKFLEASAAGDSNAAVYFGSEALIYRIRKGAAHASYIGVGRSVYDALVLFTWADVRRPFFEELTLNQKSAELSFAYDLSPDAIIKLDGKKVFVPDGSRGLFETFPSFREAMLYRLSYSLVF